MYRLVFKLNFPFDDRDFEDFKAITGSYAIEPEELYPEFQFEPEHLKVVTYPVTLDVGITLKMRFGGHLMEEKSDG